MKNYQFYVYIMANYTGTVLYTGVTNDLTRRVWEHQHHFKRRSFTSRYFIKKLVYYEIFTDINQAIDREKQLKGGSRFNKIKLIKQSNPLWDDLAAHFYV